MSLNIPLTPTSGPSTETILQMVSVLQVERAYISDLVEKTSTYREPLLERVKLLNFKIDQLLHQVIP